MKYPQEHPAEKLAGREVAYKLSVHEVKKREIPELDDDFAKDLGDFESLDELQGEDPHRPRPPARSTRRRATCGSRSWTRFCWKIRSFCPMFWSRRRSGTGWRTWSGRMMMQGIDPQKIDVDWKELREQQEEPARKAVHARLVLDAIAGEKELVVDEKEVDEKIRAEAARIGEPYGEVRKRLAESRRPWKPSGCSWLGRSLLTGGVRR